MDVSASSTTDKQFAFLRAHRPRGFLMRPVKLYTTTNSTGITDSAMSVKRQLR